MSLRKVLGCCVILACAAALVLKNREVAELRTQARALGIAGHSDSSRDTKPYGQRSDREEPRSPSAADKLAELIAEGQKEISGELVVEVDEAELFAGTSALKANGELTPEAIKLMKLTEADVLRLQESMQRFRGEAVQDLVKRLKPTVNHSDDGSLHQFHYARARRDRGQAFFDVLTREFEPVIGEKHSAALIKGMMRDDLSARLAKLDLELEVVRPKQGPVMVSYQVRSPKDGNTSEAGTKELAEFEAEFGKLFELPGGE